MPSTSRAGAGPRRHGRRRPCRRAWRPPCQSRLWLSPRRRLEVLLHVTARQESSNDEIGDFATQPLAGGLVEPKMLSPKNPAERRLVRGVAERAERPLHPGQHLGSDAELEGITPEEGREHARCG